MRRYLVLAAIALVGAAVVAVAAVELTQPEFKVRSYAGTRVAPAFPTGLDWINTGGEPLTLAALHGKILLLDFWTYGCVNCMHIIPDLKRLQEKYDDTLVVIGVHSAKFEAESDTANIRQIARQISSPRSFTIGSVRP